MVFSFSVVTRVLTPLKYSVVGGSVPQKHWAGKPGNTSWTKTGRSDHFCPNLFLFDRYCTVITMQAPENAYAVILAGGGGTRLWPKSRKEHPKHLLKLFGKESLLKITYDRIVRIIPKERILVVTVDDHVELIKEEIPNLPSENIIVEPMGKNTAIAMGVGAAFVKKRNPDGIIINLAADHIFKDVERFQAVVLAALDVANSFDYIVAIGIKPSFPHTGLGYIKVGDQIGRVRVEGKDLFAFKGLGFKEKPDLPTAQSFLATGKYLWNAGLYVWSVRTIMTAFEELAPEYGKGINLVLDAIGTDKLDQVMKKVYEESGSDPVDIAISEKSKNLVVIPGDFGWSDIGDWKIVYDSLPKDMMGNAIVDEDNNHINIDSRDCLIETNGRLVVTIGLEDLIVVDSEDAILIVPKNRTQDVKKAVEKLKEQADKKKYL